MLSTGQRVDRYIVEGRLGEGGMATVYRVRHETLGNPMALKVLTITSREVRKRLVQEGQLQATLKHDNIVQVHDVLDVHGAKGLLMEFVEGPTLEHWLTRFQPTVDEAITLFRGVCSGVGLAHAKGLVHRDLKPANILLALTEDRMTPKVTDFGLAKASTPDLRGRTKTGATMGTPGYMSPEQIRDASTVDRRADLWSLGCILYRLTCGVPPFEGDDIIELFNQVANGDYLASRDIRPDLPETVHVAIDGLLEIDHGRRVSDCATLMDFLDGVTETLHMPMLHGSLPRAAVPSTDLPRWLPAGSEAATVARSQYQETLGHLPKLKPYKVQDWSGTPGPTDRDTGDTGEHTHDDHSEQVTILPMPRRTRRPKWLVGLAGLGAAGLGFLILLVTVGVVAITIAQLSRTPEIPGTDEVAVVSPDPAEPEPERDPVTPAPLPPPVAPVRPNPPTPTPVPPRPVAPAPPRPPSGGVAKVVYSGAQSLWLENDRGPFKDLKAVPAGQYEIKARFEGQEHAVKAGTIALRAGEEASIRCEPVFVACKKR